MSIFSEAINQKNINEFSEKCIKHSQFWIIFLFPSPTPETQTSKFKPSFHVELIKILI